MCPRAHAGESWARLKHRILSGLPSPCVRAIVKLPCKPESVIMGKTFSLGEREREWGRWRGVDRIGDERRKQGAGGPSRGSCFWVRALPTNLRENLGLEYLGAGCWSHIKCPRCLRTVSSGMFWAPWQAVRPFGKDAKFFRCPDPTLLGPNLPDWGWRCHLLPSRVQTRKQEPWKRIHSRSFSAHMGKPFARAYV